MSNTAPFKISPNDWPTYRANNARYAGTKAEVGERPTMLWKYSSTSKASFTAPVSAGDRVFFGGKDGIVRCLNAKTGREVWKMYTGGRVFFPPTISEGRAYVGSADGWMYVLEAATGKLLWRFRAAPMVQRFPVYGALSSYWPVASGVMVDREGTAYVAAGMTEYHRSHVFALDAATGKIKWHNATDKFAVQGHFLKSGSQLYFAGGSGASPVRLDPKDGKMNPKFRGSGPRGARGSRGMDIQLVPYSFGKTKDGKHQIRTEPKSTMGKMLYDPGDHRPFDQNLMVVANTDFYIYSAGSDITAYEKGTGLRFYKDRVKSTTKPELWKVKTFGSKAGMALAKNALITIGSDTDTTTDKQTHGIKMLDLKDGKVKWENSLPAAPAHWGIAVDSVGRIVVTLYNGSVVCFGR